MSTPRAAPRVETTTRYPVYVLGQRSRLSSPPVRSDNDNCVFIALRGSSSTSRLRRYARSHSVSVGNCRAIPMSIPVYPRAHAHLNMYIILYYIARARKEFQRGYYSTGSWVSDTGGEFPEAEHIFLSVHAVQYNNIMRRNYVVQ